MLPKASELIKLAKACRRAGIVSFKSPEYEFILTEDAPVTNRATKKLFLPIQQSQGEIETDSLSPEDLLFYSVSNPIERATE